jgi:hypothetical protein
VLGTLKELGYRGQDVALAVPSQWCLCGTITTADLPRKSRRQAMVYRLEQQLPLPVEEITVDFIESHGQALGVCVQNSVLTPIVDALEGQGIAVQVICPVALLAIQSQIGGTGGKHAVAADLICMQHNGYIDLFEIKRQVPVAWYRAPSTVANLRLQVQRQLLRYSDPLHLDAEVEDPSLLNSLSDLEEVHVSSNSAAPIMERVIDAAGDLMQRGSATCVNLRRDALGADDPFRTIRRPLNFAVAGLVVLLVAFCAASLWRAQGYQQLIHQHERQQQEVFRRLLPTQEVPVEVQPRLASEERRLRALSGMSSESPDMKSALLLLREALMRLPDHLRFRILEIRIENDHLHIDGEARAHSDADAIAAALRTRRGFDVDPPRTDALAQRGVRFTITATAITDGMLRPADRRVAHP